MEDEGPGKVDVYSKVRGSEYNSATKRNTHAKGKSRYGVTGKTKRLDLDNLNLALKMNPGTYVKVILRSSSSFHCVNVSKFCSLIY